MVQVIARPTPTAFVKNPIVYRFRAVDNNSLTPYRSYGARAEFEADLGFHFQDGDTLTLHFQEPDSSNTTIIFTAKDTLTLDTHIPTATPLSTVINFIAAHRFVAPHIRVYYTTTGSLELITAEVRRAELGWLIDFAQAIQNTTLSTNTNTDTYIGTNAPDGYGIAYEVFFESQYNTRNWKRVHTGILHIRDDGGDLYINLSDVLTAECLYNQKENPFTGINRDRATATDNVRRFYIRYREIANNNNTWVQEDIQKIIIGGIMNQVWLSQDWFTFMPSDLARSWLTHRPAQQQVRFNTINWISWYNFLSETAEIQLELKWLDYNGNNEQKMVLNSRGQVEPNIAITFCTTPSVFGLNPNTRLYSIRVVLVATGIPLSTWREYIIDTSPRRHSLTLAYLNGFGCPETIACSGEFSKNISFQTNLTEAVRGVNYAGSITRTERNAFDLDFGYTYRTGYINAAMREVLNEVALSPVLFDITTPNYLALVLKAGTQVETFNHTDETLYSIEWQANLKIAVAAFGTDKELRDATVLSEPIMSLRRAGDTDTALPDFIGDDIPSSGGSNSAVWEYLGEIKDTDKLLFAKVNAAGELIGHRWVESGKYMRTVRGIALDAASHLDGIGIKDAETGTISTLKTDKYGSPNWE